MRTVCKLDMCSACGVCVNICKKDAIEVVDNIKACNAVIDETKCVDCGMCEKVCPTNNPVEKKSPILWKQGWACEEEIRKNSSSGGFATAIEKSFIENGGVVCSCVFNGGEFSFDFALETNDLKKFTGSKYVKSNPVGIYTKVKEYLKNGTKVLFVGLPCQCAAVKKFTNDNALLYTVDLICHGTPSKELLHMFLKEKGYKIQDIKNLNFRKKIDFHLSKDESGIEPKSVRDRYTMAFLGALCYTENCYSCQYASCERVSDLTLGDSWGSELLEDEQKKGISLALCQTEKGQELLNIANLYLENVDLDTAIKNNRQLNTPSKKPDEYKLFYSTLLRTQNFNKAVKKCYFKDCVRQDIKAFLIKSKLIKR